MTETSKDCACSAAPKLIFSCSGAADVGEVADRVARELTRKGAGKMFCLAGIGGRVSGIMATTQAAARILAIDGCKLDCARLCLEQAGFKDFPHVRLSDLSMEKGKTSATEENIQAVVEACASRISC